MSIKLVDSELRLWTMSCGCPKPVLVWSSDSTYRMCQNCGVVIINAPKDARENVEFVHLKVHTHLSFLKAICKTEDLIAKALQYNMKALAKTEFGNMCGAPSFVKECKEAGIKPILGTTFDVKFGEFIHPITFIALNHCGYKSLVRLNTIAWTLRHEKNKGPKIHLDDIEGNGLLLLIGVETASPPLFASIIDQILAKPEILSTHVILTASHHNPRDEASIDLVKSVAQSKGLKIIPVNDVLYTNSEDHDAYQVATKIGHHDCAVQDHEYYFKSPEEMWSLPFEEQWYRNTIDIAGSVEDYGIVNKEFIVPTFKDRNGEWTIEQSAAKLQMDAWQGLARKGLADKPEYIERLEYELSVMKRKNFSSYFLIISEIVEYVKSRGWMPQAGRGSAVGSLVCYCLDIIAMDPIRWGIPFERFINEGRKNLPDIDTDITQEGRPEVLKHIADIHGHDRVAQIATYQTMGLKAAIDNVGRVLGVPFISNRELRNKISEEAETIDDLQDDVKSELVKVKGWVDYSKTLSGVTKNFGIHAAGIAIANTGLGELVPLLPESDGILGIQYDMKDLEILGLLKLDMLGLRNLDIIQDSVLRIKQQRGVFVDVHQLPFDDRETYQLISSGDYVSLFQLDSPGYRKLCRQLQPDKFEHLMALNALFRPGPLESGVVSEYIERRHGRQPVISWHPWLDEVLNKTYGTVIYQESAMAMSRIIAGFTPEEADEFRIGIGKKLPEVVDKCLAKFKAGALSREGLTVPPGYSGTLESWIDQLIGKLHGYARYLWNSAHANGYSRLTYITAYLEAHYPVEYYAALLNSTDKPDKITSLMRGILHRGYKVVPPDVNESGVGYSTSDQDIYMGLSGIRSVGNSAHEIVEERNRAGKFSGFIEFCQRLPSVNKTVKINLIKAGAFRWDKFLCDRDKIDNIDIIHKIIRKKTKKFDGSKMSPVQIAVDCYITGNEFTDIQKQQNEREVLNSFITGHPAAVYQKLAPHLERSGAFVVCPSMVRHCEIGQTVLLVGMVDQVTKKFITKEGHNKGKPYLLVHISDNEESIFTNIWHPMCDDLEKILSPGQVGLFECTTRDDKFRPDTISLHIKHAVMLTHGLPIQGVFCQDSMDPAPILQMIGGILQNVVNVGTRKYAGIRGRITVMPDVLENVVDEFKDVQFLVNMESVESNE